MLYLVATPIGNLADITLRAIETLTRCTYILCEDTRHSRVLLDHYKIKTSLKSFHKFNEASKQQEVFTDLKDGLHIALISDAGTPAICDPGARLIAQCKNEGIPVTVVPGACAFVSAVSLSGWQLESFQFVGFLPKSQGQLQKKLEELLSHPGTSVAYETSMRLTKTLALLTALRPSAKLCVARELTKLHEECKTGTAQELFDYYTKHSPKGEVVLLIDGMIEPSDEKALLEQIKKLLETTTLSEAVRIVASQAKVSRKSLYTQAHLALKDHDC